jgi:hypothetical protein
MRTGEAADTHPSLRGAEGDEAIQNHRVTLDCFASLAMTAEPPAWKGVCTAAKPLSTGAVMLRYAPAN